MFSKIDLHDTYHQIQIKEGDEWKSAFRTCYRHFEYLVIPFGMANALATFQAFMETTLEGLIHGCYIVYMIDILIYMEEPQQHMEHLWQILDQLQNVKLHAKRSKCCFYQEGVQFLRFYISVKGITMETPKVQAIKDWPMPKSVNDIQIFLGFANFY